MILAANSVKGAFAEFFFYAYWRGFYFYAWRDPPVSLRLKQEKKAVGGSIPTAFFFGVYEGHNNWSYRILSLKEVKEK